MVCLNPEEAFHIHTWRCGHAGDEREDAYIRVAMYLGAKQITFTDHAPFPGDSFHGRMKMAELPEYIETLSELKAKYQGKIQVRIGLEAEYLPGFLAYYEKLREDERIEYLLLGQHFYELAPGVYSFSMKEKSGQADGIVRAELAGGRKRIFLRCRAPGTKLSISKTWRDGGCGAGERTCCCRKRTPYSIGTES